MLPRTGTRISASVMACAGDTVRARAAWLADGERRALAVLADNAWLGHLRADPVDAADGALGLEDLPVPPTRIERDAAPVS
jgi:hypothetical protein